MREQVVLACECGATVKCSDMDGVTRLAVERIWHDIHRQHKQVACWEANLVRSGNGHKPVRYR